MHCTYSYPPTTASPSNKCIAAAFVKIGTSAAAVIEPLENVGQGSPSIQFSGAPDDVNRALAGIAYKTNLYYNLLYRPPVSERPALFDITADVSDSLLVLVNDLGNSGACLCVSSLSIVDIYVYNGFGTVYQEANFVTRGQRSRNSRYHRLQ